MTKESANESDRFGRYSISRITLGWMPRWLSAVGIMVLVNTGPMRSLAGRVIHLTCDNGAKVMIRELHPESTHRYVMGDLIEVRMWGERFQGEPYRVGAAPTASFGGRWVYLGNADDGFSVLRSSRSEFWWIDRDDLGKWTCVEAK